MEKDEVHDISILPIMIDKFDTEVSAYCLIGIEKGKAILELRGFELILFEDMELIKGKLIYISIMNGAGFTSIKTHDIEFKKNNYYKKLIKETLEGYK